MPYSPASKAFSDSGLCWVAVWHHHVRQRRPVHYRPDPAFVLIPNGVEHQPLPGSEPNPHPPLLPGYAMAFNLEACAFRLDYVQGLQVVTKLPSVLVRELGGVVAGLGRQGHHAVVVHPHHFHAVQVHHRGDPFDGTSVTVVGGTAPHEVASQHQPASLLVSKP